MTPFTRDFKRRVIEQRIRLAEKVNDAETIARLRDEKKRLDEANGKD